MGYFVASSDICWTTFRYNLSASSSMDSC